MPRSTDAMMGAKPKNLRRAASHILADFKPLLGIFIFVIFILLASSTLSVLLPIFLGEFVNNFKNLAVKIDGIYVIDWPEVLKQVAVMMSFYVGSALFMWLADWIVVKISADYAYDVRSKIKDKLDRLPLSYFDKNTYGEILSRGTNDVDNISRNMSHIINQSILGISMFLGTVIAMFVTSWQLALVAIAILPFTILFTVLIAVNAQKEFKKYRAHLGKLNSIAEENYSGFKIVKLFNKENDVAQAFEKVNETMMKADWKSQWLSGFIFPTMRFIGNLGFIGVSVVGGILQNPGDMVAFFLFLQMFQQPFQQIGQISSVIQSVLASGERIYELINEPEMEVDSQE
ncbi:MAG TPA: ABC transporter ATP-binding protein, partial [Bacilli bacterium]|nr:ABC transporter ATP-binding protein [Bacilli bacterium]